MAPRRKPGEARTASSPTGAPPAQRRKRAARPGQQQPAPRYGPRQPRDDGDAGDWDYREQAQPAQPAGNTEWAERKVREAQAWQERLPQDKAAYRASYALVEQLRVRKLGAAVAVVQGAVDCCFASHVCVVGEASASSSAVPVPTCVPIRYVTHLGGAVLQVPNCTLCKATVHPYHVGCASWTPVGQAGWVDQDLLLDAHYSLMNGQSLDGEYNAGQCGWLILEDF